MNRSRRPFPASGWRPTVRAMSWVAPVAASALSLVVVLQLRVLRPELTADGYTLRLQIVAMILAATASVALDDPAAATFVSSPTVHRARSSARIALVVMWWAAAWIPTMVVLSSTRGRPDLEEIGLQSAALLVIALGIAALAGQIAGAVAVFVTAIIAAILPSTWSLLDGDARSHSRLALLTACALAALAWGTRDPAATRVRRSRPSWMRGRTITP